jgi:hypothetical protein
MDNPWFDRWYKGAGVIRLDNELNHFSAKHEVACAIRPGAEAVRGWRTLNRPTVCTGARLRTGLVFTLKRACEPGLFKEGANCRTRDNKLEEGDFQEA